MAGPELRIGITCRNDRDALELCLGSIARTTADTELEVIVVDHESRDGSADLAAGASARVLVRPWNQTESINYLVGSSRAKYTLLLHSDVVLLEDGWFPHLVRRLEGNVALVSPDDSGVGAHMRKAYGSGHPESSFMLWRTALVRTIRRVHPSEFPRRARVRLPLMRTLDLYNLHLTHQLASDLARQGLSWTAMTVLPSPRTTGWYHHAVPEGACWDPEWATLEYGFGNFYALEGRITHYHQWLTRFSDHDLDLLNDDGFPIRFLTEAAARFRADYLSGSVKIPHLSQ